MKEKDDIQKPILEGKLKEARIITNEFGEPSIPPEYTYELTEVGKAEIKKASDILKKYELFIEPKQYLEIKEKHNKIKSKFSQTKERINISFFLGITWYLVVFYSSFITENIYVSFIFTTLIFLIIIYLFVYKNDFDTF
ncbi:MAG: hypothetical protein IPM56_01725 [Ignavibacteriales bacterium]|nr:MAG: hypothetical protein IPM56_01725 [Ignavibacteriales bacterium]